MGFQSPKCPRCGHDMKIAEVDFRLPFPCPWCNGFLYVPEYYSYLWSFLAFGVALLLCSVFGLRGMPLFLFAVIIWFPVLFLVIFWVRHVTPPRLRPYG